MLNIDIVFIIYGILLIFVSSLTIIVKEPKTPEIAIGANLKSMFSTKKNWKVYIFAFFTNIIDAFMTLFVALFILIQWGLVEPEGASIGILEENIDLYTPQSLANLLIAVGIIIGSIIGGRFADLKSRKISMYLGYIFCSVSFLLMLINLGPIMYIIFAVIIGFGAGWRSASYSAIMGQISQQYPEMDGTFFSLGNSFTNAGTILGLSISGVMFNVFGAMTSNYLIIYGAMLIFIALLQAIAPFSLWMIKSEEYEVKSAK